MTYEVQTEVFAGPFDLLLHLILREQVDLYEVSLSPIVAVRTKPFSALVKVTVAPKITRPCPSKTVPLTDVVPDCALRFSVKKVKVKTAINMRESFLLRWWKLI